MSALLRESTREPTPDASAASAAGLPLGRALRVHWPEYAMEAAGLGIFMLAAVLCTVLLEWPGSPVHAALPDAFVRRAWMGAAMGATAMAIIYSPLGQGSGAHINPAVTLTFYRLGKIERSDALFYVLAQVLGALAGVLLAMAALAVAGLPAAAADPHVNFAVTAPRPGGRAVAFAAEIAISFGMMTAVLALTNRPRIARWTGVCAGLLVASYIAFEAPLSGMSMNPARTLGSALPAHAYDALWIYFTAPVLGMLAAAEVHLRTGRVRHVLCAKLHHPDSRRCIFRCGWPVH